MQSSRSVKQILVYWGALSFLVSSASAHPYLPLVPGNTLTTLPSGERLEDCIEVVRRIPSNPAWQDFSIYCRGISAVETRILQKTPVGLYRTETRLRSYKKAP